MDNNNHNGVNKLLQEEQGLNNFLNRVKSPIYEDIKAYNKTRKALKLTLWQRLLSKFNFTKNKE